MEGLNKKTTGSMILVKPRANLCTLVGECSSELVSSKAVTPLDELRGEVSEFLRRLRDHMNMRLANAIEEAIKHFPMLDLVHACDGLVGGETWSELCCAEDGHERLQFSCMKKDVVLFICLCR